MCLIMADIEALKPSNTGWLVADVVPDTFAFGWTRTGVDPELLALLADPQWQPYVVFPADFVATERLTTALLPDSTTPPQSLGRGVTPRLPSSGLVKMMGAFGVPSAISFEPGLT